MQKITRRDALKVFSAGALASSLSACVTMGQKSVGKVVVVGAGYGGATAAKYLRLWSDGAVDVTLVEPNEAFISCPMSNLVLGGSKTLADVTVSYSGLDKYGVKRVRDTASAIDVDKKQVRLASGATLPYDRLVVSPGIELMYDRLQGWGAAGEASVLHAWKAGPQTVALRRQLTEMKDGGVVVMSIPLAPYRCPPGPYERACQIAWYLKQSKPKSKLLVLDANPDYVSKKPLFSRVFGEDYKGIVEYRVASPVNEIDLKSSTLVTEIGEKVRGDVVNYIPPQRAANIARDAGLITANNRWCEVNWSSMESVKVPNVHVLGDSTLSAPAMPKSGHMANQHGKAAAAAIVELLNGRTVVPPTMANTCYSFIDDRSAVHVDSVHRWSPEKKTLEPVAGAGGISSQDRASWALEGAYAQGWATTIWADMLG
ncbi:MAG: NAD(P)/FAD-dependent oxidoreductase [Pseudomonadota bacterium]|nr:FAD-dependent oxidoreductase [Burkholderiaceae bacterium]MDQ3446555.1 NAD(P)/FAD-dependent oxidoreductase [Pseudomonadota bacterium]